MLVSVIIPTYNRANQIANILDALTKQTCQKFEVVIVNDGSKDNTAEVLERLKDIYPFVIRPINITNGGRANARNTGAKYAEGDILLFYDDDVRPNPKSVSCHYEFHAFTAKVPSILDGPALFDKALIEGDFALWRMGMEHQWYKQLPDPMEKKNNCSLTGANKSILKSTWDQIGGMKDGLNDAEDFELGFRSKHEYGIPIFTCWDSWVYHDDFKTFEEFLHRRYMAMGAGKKLFMDNPQILEIYPHRWIFNPKFPRSIIFKLFRTKFIIKFIAKSRLFTLLPQKVRHRLYNIAVMAANIYCKQF